MNKAEMVKVSPIRSIDSLTQGGLGQGRVGLILASKGIGKTACLVQIATDQLLQDKKVLHISFTDNTKRIQAWYDEIYHGMANRFHLDQSRNLYDLLIRNRFIISFKPNGEQVDRIQKTVSTLLSSQTFEPDMIVIDGYDLTKTDIHELIALRNLAETLNVEIWVTGTYETSQTSVTASKELNEGLHAEYLDYFEVVLVLTQSNAEVIHLNLIKSHKERGLKDLELDLDPNIFLLHKIPPKISPLSH